MYRTRISTTLFSGLALVFSPASDSPAERVYAPTAPGQLPIIGNATEVILKKQVESAPDPKLLQPDAPEGLNELCQRLLELDPSRRPGAIEVLEAVDAADEAKRLRSRRPKETRGTVAPAS